MGLKFQKKSDSSEFIGKERAALELVLKTISHHITISACETFSSDDIVSTTVGMALKQSSPTATYKVPNYKFPSATTFWTCLNTIKFEELKKNNVALFREYLHQFLKIGESYVFAIDEVDDCFYGEIVPQNEDHVVGGKQKKSTNFFYRYITLYSTIKHRRVTLAVFPVQNSIKKMSYIQQIIEIIRSEGYGIKILLLDRGFFSRDIYHYLQNEEIPHIMPAKAQGKEMISLLANEELRQFTYILCKNKETALEIEILRYTESRSKKDGTVKRKHHGFVVFGVDWNLTKVKRFYRSRFAIESSYRMRNIVRPKTSTRNPVIRYYFAIVSFLLKNVWFVLLFENFRKKQSGPVVIISEWFRFDAFIDFMMDALKLIRNSSNQNQD
ncbi:MAG: hypothetical protein V1862_13220 [Methanobacteriota archaeon]